jgi:hypothetical protein
MKDVPAIDIDECLEKIFRQAERTIFYSLEELDTISAKQLENLAQRMEDINLGSKIIKSIIENLNWHRDSAVEIAAGHPMFNDRQSRYIPIIPIISETVINMSIQMELLQSNGQSGKNTIPLPKIKNECKRDRDFYWLVDVRINEPRYNCHYLTAAEAVAYSFHNNIFNIEAVNSRYKYKKHYPELCILNEDEPLLVWKNSLSANSIKRLAKPNAAWRLIH